jgi:hypothetical protein
LGPRSLGRYFTSVCLDPPLEVHLAELAVSRRRSVAILAAVTRVSVLGTGVAETVAVDVAEIPCLAGEYGLVAVEVRLPVDPPAGFTRLRLL